MYKLQDKVQRMSENKSDQRRKTPQIPFVCTLNKMRRNEKICVFSALFICLIKAALHFFWKSMHYDESQIWSCQSQKNFMPSERWGGMLLSTYMCLSFSPDISLRKRNWRIWHIIENTNMRFFQKQLTVNVNVYSLRGETFVQHQDLITDLSTLNRYHLRGKDFSTKRIWSYSESNQCGCIQWLPLIVIPAFPVLLKGGTYNMLVFVITRITLRITPSQNECIWFIFHIDVSFHLFDYGGTYRYGGASVLVFAISVITNYLYFLGAIGMDMRFVGQLIPCPMCIWESTLCSYL